MEKKLLSRLVAMLVMALIPLLSQAVNTIIYNATYDFSNLTLGTDTLGGVTYTTVNYEGLFNDGDPGLPSLPIDYIKFSVPWNATNFSVTATLQNSHTENLSYSNQLVYPCQPARMMNDTTHHPITLPDSSTYNSSSFYPSQKAWVVDEGFLAGENHVVTVAVMPISYRHFKTGMITTNQIKETQTVRLVLSYDLSDHPAMLPIIREDTTLRQEGYALTQSIVANPDNVVAFAPVGTQVNPDGLAPFNLNSGDGLNGGGLNPISPPDSNSVYGGDLEKKTYSYLIVTTPELVHSVRRLAALKRQKGYTVKIVTMNDVLNDSLASLGDRFKRPDGTYYVAYNNSAGKLRQYLKNAYRYWGTQYVLLAGDSVPYKQITMYPYEKQMTFQSDLYFCDLNADWSNDTIEKYPELFIGRLIAKNREQVINYTDKVFRYELDPGNGDFSYLKRAFYSQGYDMRENHEINYIRNVLDSIYSNPFIMQETDIIDEPVSFPSGRDIINELNNTRYSFLSFHHHGYPSSLLTCGLRKGNHKASYRFLWAIDTDTIADTNYRGDDKLTENGLNNLTNKDYPNICYSIACTTMPFQLPAYYVENGLKMSFGESFTTGRDYGGPVYIGNTFEGFTPTSAWLETYIFNETLKGHYKLGEANGYGKSNAYINKDKVVSDYIMAIQNYLGDPSLELWTDIPQKYQNINIIRTDNSVTISGIDMNSTIVSCCNNNGVVIRKLATSNVVTLSSIAPNGTIMLYRHNSIPFIAPMVLQKVSLNKSQYVIASDVTAGYAVDNDNRTSGDVIVKSGVEYEIEASGTVTLCDGFEVEKGATFAVYPSNF